MNIPIIFENDEYVVINKPVGIPVHGDGKKEVPTIADWFMERYPEAHNVGESMHIEYQGASLTLPRPGIVHRLDAETSGCMVLAKTQERYLFLKRKFKARAVTKAYRAYVFGLIKNDRGIIDVPIGRQVGSHARFSAGRNTRGVVRDARTRYVVSARGSYEGMPFTCITAYPETGRTHQIRVHMKYVHHPLICDALYAPNQQPLLGFNRLALHAEMLVIPEPGGGERECHAPLPPDFLFAEQYHD
jgi:23S rRNA pseudouridine1911/1915/1917 synthase